MYNLLLSLEHNIISIGIYAARRWCWWRFFWNHTPLAHTFFLSLTLFARTCVKKAELPISFRLDFKPIFYYKKRKTFSTMQRSTINTFPETENNIVRIFRRIWLIWRIRYLFFVICSMKSYENEAIARIIFWIISLRFLIFQKPSRGVNVHEWYIIFHNLFIFYYYYTDGITCFNFIRFKMNNEQI